MKSFDELKQRLAGHEVKRVVAVVASHDEHTLEAVVRAKKENLVEPLLIGDEEKTKGILTSLGEDFASYRIINEPDGSSAAQIAADLAREGKVDCIMKGHLETGVLMKVMVNKEHGIRKGSTMSLLAIMESPYYDKLFGITDVGLLTYPDKDQKEAALINAVDAFHRLGVSKPKVAIICAVEKVNPKMPETVDADAIKKDDIQGCIVEGPISYDLAMDKNSAAIKGYESPVAGDADILVVPDIVSGNIAAKTITCVGGGRTGGTVLGGIVPVLLVSRSASSEDKYLSIIVIALIGGAK